MNTPRPLSIRRSPAGLLLQASLLLIATTAHAIPIMTDHAPARGRVMVEDFSRFEPPSYANPFVTANGTIEVPEEVRIYEGDICGDSNRCLGQVNEDWDVLFRNLPARTLFWSTDFYDAGSALTTWTVIGRSGVSVFSNLSYQPNFAFFDPRGLISMQLQVTPGLDANGDPIIAYYRFDNITTFSVPEAGGIGVLCAAFALLLVSYRSRHRWGRRT